MAAPAIAIPKLAAKGGELAEKALAHVATIGARPVLGQKRTVVKVRTLRNGTVVTETTERSAQISGRGALVGGVLLVVGAGYQTGKLKTPKLPGFSKPKLPWPLSYFG